MASTKVMVRDKVAANLGGQLLTLDGAMAHALSLNLPGRSPPLSDSDAFDMAGTLLNELRRRFNEVTIMRNRSALLEVTIRLNDNAIGDRGCRAIASSLIQCSGIAIFKSVIMYNNAIGDDGARAIAQLVRQAKHPVEEARS